MLNRGMHCNSQTSPFDTFLLGKNSVDGHNNVSSVSEPLHVTCWFWKHKMCNSLRYIIQKEDVHDMPYCILLPLKTVGSMPWWTHSCCQCFKAVCGWLLQLLGNQRHLMSRNKHPSNFPELTKELPQQFPSTHPAISHLTTVLASR